MVQRTFAKADKDGCRRFERAIRTSRYEGVTACVPWITEGFVCVSDDCPECVSWTVGAIRWFLDLSGAWSAMDWSWTRKAPSRCSNISTGRTWNSREAAGRVAKHARGGGAARALLPISFSQAVKQSSDKSGLPKMIPPYFKLFDCSNLPSSDLWIVSELTDGVGMCCKWPTCRAHCTLKPCLVPLALPCLMCLSAPQKKFQKNDEYYTQDVLPLYLSAMEIHHSLAQL